MTNSPTASMTNNWPLVADGSAADDAKPRVPVKLGARAPLAGLAMLRDSARILGAFAWGKDARLSRNKSAELCQLMDGWN